MDLIARLRETRPSLSFEELLAVRSPSVRYEGEDELRDERGDLRRFRVYSIDGFLFDGAPMLVPAAHAPSTADAFAEQGLLATLVMCKESVLDWRDQLSTEIIAPATDSVGLTGEQKAHLERILNG